MYLDRGRKDAVSNSHAFTKNICIRLRCPRNLLPNRIPSECVKNINKNRHNISRIGINFTAKTFYRIRIIVIINGSASET